MSMMNDDERRLEEKDFNKRVMKNRAECGCYDDAGLYLCRLSLQFVDESSLNIHRQRPGNETIYAHSFTMIQGRPPRPTMAEKWAETHTAKEVWEVAKRFWDAE